MSELEDPYGDDALAAEYVLHLLDDSERQSFESRLRTDRELQALVNAWEAMLAPFGEDISEELPPTSIRKRILRSIEGKPRSRRTVSPWAWLAGGLAAVGVAAFVLFGNNFGSGTNLTPAFQAELATEDRSVIVVAGVFPATHEIVIEHVAGAAPQGRVHELWLIAEGSSAPVSLGLIENEGATRIRVPDEIAPGVRTGTIAISIEPVGGSPTGAPTGPVVATAQFSDV